MQESQQALISFFQHVAEKNTAVLEKLKHEQCFNIEQNRWCFTLTDLHAFLQLRTTCFVTLNTKYSVN